MVSGYKRCPNGHFYKEDLANCPYCGGSVGAANPNPNATMASPEYGGGRGSDSTMPGGGAMPVGGATIPAGGAAMGGGGGMGDPNKTRVMPDMGAPMGGETVPNYGGTMAPPAEPQHMTPPPMSSASKTMIFDDSAQPGTGAGEVRSARKLVGWLVSYTLSDMGIDYKLT